MSREQHNFRFRNTNLCSLCQLIERLDIGWLVVNVDIALNVTVIMSHSRDLCDIVRWNLISVVRAMLSDYILIFAGELSVMLPGVVVFAFNANEWVCSIVVVFGND